LGRGTKRRETPHQLSPTGRTSAGAKPDRLPSKTRKRDRNDSRTSTGRRPLTPRERRLVAGLRARLTESRISQAEAARIAGVDKSDVCRVFNFGPATPRTLRRLFEAFNVNEYEDLNAAERREALLLEIRAAVERQAELLGELAALAAASDPPTL
jgi:transcriptional regulator with XRE-family HTH domain